MSASQEPMLMEGPLTGNVYVVTSYKVIDAERGLFEARKKFDVTAQFEALVAKRALSGSVAESDLLRTDADASSEKAVLPGVYGTDRP